MITKKYIEAIGREVSFAKRKGTKHIRLSIKTDGTIRVSVPYGVPLIAAERFMLSKLDWIEKNTKDLIILRHGDRIGKSHQLTFTSGAIDTIKTRISKNIINIMHPKELLITDPKVQVKAKSACERALKQQASSLLPQRLDYWSSDKSINYKSVSIKKMKSRWGSCDNRKNIVLNMYLIQLDWPLIDYVILHELNHIDHPHHQKSFWESMESLLPDYAARRKLLKTKPTDILQTNF